MIILYIVLGIYLIVALATVGFAVWGGESLWTGIKFGALWPLWVAFLWRSGA